MRDSLPRPAARAAAKKIRFDAAFPWIAPRFVAWLIADACVIALGAFWAPLAALGAFGFLVLLGFVLVDFASGPRRGEVVLAREPVEHLALRSPGALRYSIINRSAVPIRYSIVDTPVDMLQMP